MTCNTETIKPRNKVSGKGNHPFLHDPVMKYPKKVMRRVVNEEQVAANENEEQAAPIPCQPERRKQINKCDFAMENKYFCDVKDVELTDHIMKSYVGNNGRHRKHTTRCLEARKSYYDKIAKMKWKQQQNIERWGKEERALIYHDG